MHDKVKELLSENDGYLRIKVLPKSSSNEIVDIMGDETVKIRIKAIPEKGKANSELIGFLSKTFDIPKDQITIISGKTDQIKLIRIQGA